MLILLASYLSANWIPRDSTPESSAILASTVYVVLVLRATALLGGSKLSDPLRVSGVLVTVGVMVGVEKGGNGVLVAVEVASTVGVGVAVGDAPIVTTALWTAVP